MTKQTTSCRLLRWCIFSSGVIFALTFCGTTVESRGYNFNFKYGWVNGSRIPSSFANWGVLGVEDPANFPPDRESGVLVRDPNPNFPHIYLSGGYGTGLGEPYPTVAQYSYMADTWKYNTVSQLWTWVNGPTASNQDGVSGSNGVYDPSYYPISRLNAAVCGSVNPGNRKMYLYGGTDHTGAVTSDFWAFDMQIWQWALINNFDGNVGSGSPGVRDGSTMVHVYTDKLNHLYLFGGFASNGIAADLWRYSLTDGGMWSLVLDLPGALYSPSVFPPAANPYPGGRRNHAMASAGTQLFIFGGSGYDQDSSNIDATNDLWSFSIDANQWTFLRGNPADLRSGLNYTMGVPDPFSYPLGREFSQLSFLPSVDAYNQSTAGSNAKLLLSGGHSSGSSPYRTMNDIWIYEVNTTNWVWIKGTTFPWSVTQREGPPQGFGAYGVMSVSNTITPRASHMLCLTTDPTSTTGSDTIFFVYGGHGAPYSFPGTSTQRTLQDLWAFSLADPCPCNPLVSTGCDILSQCICKANYTGFDCEQCSFPGAIGWPYCHVCFNASCPAQTGYNGIGGRECNVTSLTAFCGSCPTGQFSSPGDPYCHDCRCNTVGTIGGSAACNQDGLCTCSTFFTGARCDSCVPGASGPFCLPFSSSAPIPSSSAPFSSSSAMSCNGMGGDDTRPRQVQLIFNYSTTADFPLTSTANAILAILGIPSSQLTGTIVQLEGTKVVFSAILTGDNNNCLSAFNLTMLLIHFFENSTGVAIAFPGAAQGKPAVYVVCEAGVYAPDPPGVCAYEHPPKDNNNNLSAIAAGASVGGLFCILCVLFLFWNHRKGQREGIFPIRKLIENARGNRDKVQSPNREFSTGSGLGTRSLQMQDGLGTSSRKDGSVVQDTTDSMSVVSIIDQQRALSQENQEFLARFPFIRTVKEMDEYFNYLHNLKDRQLSLEIAAKYLSPMVLLKPNTNFYLFRENDNLQRWVFPFLFKNHTSLVMSLSHSSEQNLLDLAMVLIVECHFQQFVGFGTAANGPNATQDENSSPLLVKNDMLTQSLSANSAAAAAAAAAAQQITAAHNHLGLQRTIDWLKSSREWEWGEEASTFARLILFTFMHKLQHTWNARDLDQLGFKHLFPSLHTVESFIFCSPLKQSSPDEPNAPAPLPKDNKDDRDVGLHLDASGFLDHFLIKETVKLLTAILPIIQRNIVEPAPKEHTHILERVRTELEFFTGIAAYFNDATVYVDETERGASPQRLETIEKQLLVSSENLGKLLTERIRHKKHEYTKKEVNQVFQGNIETIRHKRYRIKQQSKFKAIHDYAADHLTVKAQSDEKSKLAQKGDTNGSTSELKVGELGSPNSKNRVSRSLLNSNDSNSGHVQLHIKGGGSPGLAAISESGNVSQLQLAAGSGAGVNDNLNDRELAELKPYLIEEFLLGSGSFGSVYKAVFRGCDVAVKVIRPENAKGKAAEAFEKEIAMHLHLRSPRLLLPIRVWHKPPDLIMVTEIMARGNLRDVLRYSETDEERKDEKGSRYLQMPQRLQMAIQIAQGLMFLHRNDPPVVHRDIKPENVLVDEHYNVKLSDFGLSSTLSHLTVQNAATAVGSALYMAPELFSLQKAPISTDSNTSTSSAKGSAGSTGSSKGDIPTDAAATLAMLMRADVYSYGILLIELFGFPAPWANFSMMQLVAAHMQGQTRAAPIDMADGVKQVVNLCIQPTASERPDIGQVLAMLMKVHL